MLFVNFETNRIGEYHLKMGSFSSRCNPIRTSCSPDDPHIAPLRESNDLKITAEATIKRGSQVPGGSLLDTQLRTWNVHWGDHGDSGERSALESQRLGKSHRETVAHEFAERHQRFWDSFSLDSIVWSIRSVDEREVLRSICSWSRDHSGHFCDQRNAKLNPRISTKQHIYLKPKYYLFCFD